MIQAGMEFGTNTPYGEYTIIRIMLIPLFFFNSDGMFCVQEWLCSDVERLRSSSARQRRSSSKAPTSTFSTL